MPPKSRFISLGEAQKPFFVGVDLGGTNIKVGLVDDLGRTLSHLGIPTEISKGVEDGTARMGRSVKKVAAEAGLKTADIARVGLGSPGEMDIPTGMLVKPVNLKGWNDFPLRDKLAEQCGLPVTFENDANAAAYGEFWIGSGRDYKSMVLLTLGTGIGTGIILDDVVLQGAHSCGGECGHIIIDCHDDARLCGCGGHGHLEAYASGTAVIKRTREALDVGRTSSLSKRLADGGKLTPKMIAEEAEAGDALSREIIDETARYLGIGIVSILHTVNPEIVLLGGAMTFGGKKSALGRRFLQRIDAEIRRRALGTCANRTVLDFASLGGDAGYIGAAGVARREYRKLGQK
ncbi:MAG: ROK family protein [Pirellulales bacterium]|nr:ROK family protein [Pirellulales bacterium]